MFDEDRDDHKLWLNCQILRKIFSVLRNNFASVQALEIINIMVPAFFGKNIVNKHLCCHYFCKSNIPVIYLIIGSTNIIRVWNKLSLWKIR